VRLRTGSCAAEPDGAPLRRDGLLPRILPFTALAVLAEASLTLPPGPVSVADAAASALLLAGVAAAIAFLPWDRLPRWASVGVPLLYTASLFLLIEAAGGSDSGLTILVLIPLIWTALHHQRWESACVTMAVLGVVLAISLSSDMASATVLVRRLIFWAALGSMIAFAGHGLRARVRRSQQETARVQERLRELSIVADRDRIATSLHDTVVQRLFAAGLSLEGVAQLAGQPAITSRIDGVVRNLDESITLLRQSIFGLEPSRPGQRLLAHGLRRSILDVSNEMTPALGLVPEVTLEGPLDTIVPAHAATQLLSTLRDGLTCSGVSAPATRVAVVVAVDHDSLLLIVADNGPQWGARSAGADLSRLRERASRAGGTLATEPAVDGMTRLIWRLPLAAGGDDEPPATIPGDRPSRVRTIRRGAPSR
jgi:signal transduction histidine kinase